MINYYSILDIPVNASQSEIKAAFKQMAVRFHPDKHQGNSAMEEKFKEINQAYQVLSNPYEKARYDLTLQFGAPHQTTYTPPRPDYHYRPVYRKPPIDWKENWIATAYAFGFSLVVAIVVMTLFSIKGYYDQQKADEIRQQRRENFEAAKTHFESGEYEKAIIELNELGTFMSTEEDMKVYKALAISSLKEQAEYHYQSGSFQEAIPIFEILDQHIIPFPLALQEHQALSYRALHQPDLALQKLKYLLIQRYHSMEIYMVMAEIERDEFHNLSNAKHYYQIATEYAIERYKIMFGEAYPLFLSKDNIPSTHYLLFTNLADIYFQNQEYEQAIKATRWNIIMWPDSSSNYAISARSNFELGNQKLACQELGKATKLGYQERPFICP